MKHILYFLFVSPLAFSFESSDNCDDIELFFLSPQDGFVSENQKLKVEFGTKNINISPAGVVVEKQDNCKVSGHHHLIINADLPDLTLPIPANENYVHFGLGQTETTFTLEPGTYSLQLLMGNYLHIPHEKPLFSEVISITIE